VVCHERGVPVKLKAAYALLYLGIRLAPEERGVTRTVEHTAKISVA
jgi:hypothetical protein